MLCSSLEEALGEVLGAGSRTMLVFKGHRLHRDGSNYNYGKNASVQATCNEMTASSLVVSGYNEHRSPIIHHNGAPSDCGMHLWA